MLYSIFTFQTDSKENENRSYCEPDKKTRFESGHSVDNKVHGINE